LEEFLCSFFSYFSSLFSKNGEKVVCEKTCWSLHIKKIKNQKKYAPWISTMVTWFHLLGGSTHIEVQPSWLKLKWLYTIHHTTYVHHLKQQLLLISKGKERMTNQMSGMIATACKNEAKTGMM
jgi:hypothetical protein